MNTGSNIVRKKSIKKAIKGSILFAAMALFPVAALLAGPGPLNKDKILIEQRQESVREWKGMKVQVDSILKKADKLKNYKAIN